LKQLSGWYADYLHEYGSFDPRYEMPDEYYLRTGRKPMENDYSPAPKGKEFLVKIDVKKAWSFLKWVAECVRLKKIISMQKGEKASNT